MGKEAVQQIKERLSIIDVVASYVPVEKTGMNARAKCPFHNEKTPSFFLSPERGTYYCFGCGMKGDIFSFVQEFEGLDFKGALKLLAERAGVVLTNDIGRPREDVDILYSCLSAATDFFETVYLSSNLARDYVTKRGVTEKTRAKFRIGAAPLEWRALYDHLAQKGFSDTDIERAGLIKKTDKGQYDRFRGRLMFPMMDSSGRVIAFSGRILVDDGASAKYVNSPETVLFTKGSVLFGFDKAKEFIRKKDYAILVEGQFDLVLAHQHGFENTVATSGTAVSESILTEGHQTHFTTLKRLSNNLVIAFDGDKAGQVATIRAAKIALSLGMDVKTIRLPEGKDPADTLEEDIALWRKLLTEKKHVIESVTDRLWEVEIEERKKLVLLSEAVFPLVALVKSPVEQAFFIKYIARRVGLNEETIAKGIVKTETEPARVTQTSGAISKQVEDPERILTGLLLLNESNSEIFEIDPLSRTKALDFVHFVDDAIFVPPGIDTEALLFETERLVSAEKNFGLLFESVLSALEEKRLRAIVRTLGESLKKAENLKEPTDALLQEYTKKSRELEALRDKRQISI